MGATTIEWTDVTWNPVRGCTKVSPGCKNCYAETFAERWRGIKGHAFEQGFDLRLVPEKLAEPLTWKRPRRVFVNSMSDLFHEDVSDEYIAAVFGVMASSPKHTFQVLTKRPERMRRWFENHTGHALDWCACKADDLLESRLPRAERAMLFAPGRGARVWPLPNVWLGASVEDQKRADERIPHLFATPAHVRFLSCEPLLGPVDLSPYLVDDLYRAGRAPRLEIDWVIVGGESGPGARPYDLAWARSIIGQCRSTGVAVFHKQLGAVPVSSDPDDKRHAGDMNLPTPFRLKLLDRKGGDMRDWPDDLQVRQFPTVTP